MEENMKYRVRSVEAVVFVDFISWVFPGLCARQLLLLGRPLNLLAASASHLCPFHPLWELIYGQIDLFYPKKVLRFFSKAAWHKGLRGTACGLPTVSSPLLNLAASTIVASLHGNQLCLAAPAAESSRICNDPELSTPSSVLDCVGTLLSVYLYVFRTIFSLDGRKGFDGLPWVVLQLFDLYLLDV